MFKPGSAFRSILGVLAGLVALLTIFAFAGNRLKPAENIPMSKFPKLAPNDTVEGRRAALDLVEETLPTPATAQLRSCELLSRAKNKYLYHVVVDAQNEHGAMIRWRLCVVVKLQTDGGYRYNKTYGVQACDKNDTNLHDVIKRLNDWDEE